MKKEQNFDSLNLDDKIKMIEQIIVIHPQMQAILDKMDYCREHSKYALEAIGLLVTGEKGTGKTTIKDIYLNKNKSKQTRTATYIPVLAIWIPVPATVKGLTTELLGALGDPFPEKGSVVVQTARVNKLVEKCRVTFCLFDEFQHFAERESFKLNRTVSDWTKNFMTSNKMPMVLFGTPKSTEILDGVENEQLRRRFPFRMELRPFVWKTEEDQQIFRKFLQIVDEKLPLNEFSNLADPNIALRIHYATKGLIFEVMRLIRAAAVLAVKRGFININMDLLSESFIENVVTNSPFLENPFKS